MRIHRSVKVGLAMGVMLVSGGCAAEARAQQQPAAPPGTPALRDVLRGKAAQVRVDTTAQRAPAQRIRICSFAGHQGPGRPLVFVDGEELKHDESHEIDPQRIESIELLRGPAAVLLHGHRAADGVILVRTRRL